jgi:probable F420-dependent oxidoreductase
VDYWLFGTVQAHIEQATELAKAAERLGYAGIALPDHVAIPERYDSEHPSPDATPSHRADFPDALITLTAMAAVTSSLRLLTYVYVLPMRDPFSVAKQAGTLAMISDYRLNLGVGAGWLNEEMALLGHDPHTRGRRLDEMLQIMRELWASGVAAGKGEFYKFDTVGQFPVPKRRIPILIGGKSPTALQRAARNDGWLGMYYPMEEIRELLRTLHLERKRYLDTHQTAAAKFETMVIPGAAPAADVYHQLEDWGVDGTIAVPWDLADSKYDDLHAKIDAMQTFADRFICR